MHAGDTVSVRNYWRYKGLDWRIFMCTRAIQKDIELFFLIYCYTYNLIRLVSFKVLLSTVDTLLPAFFPVLERVMERVLQDGAKVL